MAKVDEAKIEEILSRGVEEVVVREGLKNKLISGNKLRVYFGIDPTGSKLHLGHAVVLWKLKDFQDLGHEVILLIGDFTAKIGDPSGRDVMRIPLTDKQIKENMKDYKKQASKILDFSKVKIKYNSQWLSKLTFADILKLSSQVTVHQMLHREMFNIRIKENSPISLSEFLYPLMQGYDSVVMDVDLEIAGNDQLFNMLIGRDLQKIYNNKDKNVLGMKLLLGTDGLKMSKTFNNCIYLSDNPKEMYGKLMSIKDELILDYAELCLREKAIIKEVYSMRDEKAALAKKIVTMYYGEKEAQKAEDEFNRIHRDKEFPLEPLKINVSDTIDINDIPGLLVKTGMAPSKSEAKRLVLQGAVKIDGVVEKDWQKIIKTKTGMKIQVGPRRFLELI